MILPGHRLGHSGAERRRANNGKGGLTFWEIIFEGLKKFAGEIIGGLLLAVFLYYFPGLRSLIKDYAFPSNDKAQTEIQRELDIPRAEVPRIKPAPKPKSPAMSDAVFIELCKSGNASKVEEAISNGANVNAKDYDGYTALMAATSKGNAEVVELLLKHGADINLDRNRTILVYAASAEVAEAIIKYGANVNAKDEDGWTALMFATIRGHAEVAEVLLKHGADVNAKDNNNKTVLMIAAYNDYAEVAELLLKHGANVNAKDKGGWTALTYAKMFRHTEITNVLRSYGAK